MRGCLWLLGIVSLVTLAFLTIHGYHSYQPWLAYHTGSQNSASVPPNYNYWSGFGSVFPWELGLFCTLWAWLLTHYRLNNCHVEKCPRLGRYPAAGGHYKVCRRHHPERHVRNKNVSFEHVQYSHAIHLLRSGAKPVKKDDSSGS